MHCRFPSLLLFAVAGLADVLPPPATRSLYVVAAVVEHLRGQSHTAVLADYPALFVAGPSCYYPQKPSAERGRSACKLIILGREVALATEVVRTRAPLTARVSWIGE